MKTLNLVGPDAVGLADRLVPRLDGRVATVETLPETAARDTDAGAAYGLSRDGSWLGAGDGRTLTDLLDSLVPDYDHALTVGFDDDVPVARDDAGRRHPGRFLDWVEQAFGGPDRCVDHNEPVNHRFGTCWHSKNLPRQRWR